MKIRLRTKFRTKFVSAVILALSALPATASPPACYTISNNGHDVSGNPFFYLDSGNRRWILKLLANGNCWAIDASGQTQQIYCSTVMSPPPNPNGSNMTDCKLRAYAGHWVLNPYLWFP